MSDSEIKVNDKRMFTPEGELREEYKHLEESAPSEPEKEPPRSEEPEEPPRSQEPPELITDPSAPPPKQKPADGAANATGKEPGKQRPSGPIAGDPPSGEPRLELGAKFQDLVALLAEHAAVYLGERSMPDGRSMQDLQAAQLHIDLLDVLREKTSGNLSEQEARLLEDVLYQLRLVYVEKRRQGA